MILTLLEKEDRTVGTVNGNPMTIGEGAKSIGFFLDVSDCGIDAGDTLDVKIQHSPDGGTNWDDIVHFTQVLGNDGDDTYQEIAFIYLDLTPEDEMRTLSTSSLAAGNVIQGPIFPLIRATGTIVDADADGNFEYSVTMQVNR